MNDKNKFQLLDELLRQEFGELFHQFDILVDEGRDDEYVACLILRDDMNGQFADIDLTRADGLYSGEMTVFQAYGSRDEVDPDNVNARGNFDGLTAEQLADEVYRLMDTLEVPDEDYEDEDDQ